MFIYHASAVGKTNEEITGHVRFVVVCTKRGFIPDLPLVGHVAVSVDSRARAKL
jgi:hypothetical protein